MVGTALITGASRGLGLALARGLAGRGWHLLLTARDGARLGTVAEELAERTRVTALAGDVTDASHRAALVAAAQHAGGLDVLINNAGALGPSPQPALMDYPLEVLRDVFETNVFAPLALVQVLKPVFAAGARLVNVTSDAAVNAYGGWGGYGSSKAALEQWSAVLAAEEPELRVYWIDPGDLRTAMHQAAYPGEDISDRPLPESVVPAFLALLEGGPPSGRYVAPALLEAAAGSA